ncbi:flagellar hook-basal body complex protein [Novosphingobium aquimarinum]|uniref:flagellar hook-basal body complex protein n=1 Tax=Novosphingobium aquimarinum TaxID=2682494 RepID=UPI0012ECB459|nr:flagellar hook-basal body complex protein [Novosphingobium aquimarinum]
MSFYTSISGLKNAQTDLNVISQNIANAETTGFKRSRTEFADIVAGSAFTNPRNIQGIGSTVQSITQNFAIGPIEQTGSALDLAISGDGFFQMKNGATGDALFTRNGSFTLDDQGFVTDGSNNRLQIFAIGDDPATATPVDAQIPATNAAGFEFAGVVVGEDGVVSATYADGTTDKIGQVGLATFLSPTGLKQVGSSNWEVSGLSGAPTFGYPNEGAYGGLISGALELSNVDIAEELVNLITAQRYFQANAKAIDTATQISQTIIQLRS